MGILGAIVQWPVKRKVLTEQAHCEFFLKWVTIPTNIFLRLNLHVNLCTHIFIDTVSTIIFS